MIVSANAAPGRSSILTSAALSVAKTLSGQLSRRPACSVNCLELCLDDAVAGVDTGLSTEPAPMTPVPGSGSATELDGTARRFFWYDRSVGKTQSCRRRRQNPHGPPVVEGSHLAFCFRQLRHEMYALRNFLLPDEEEAAAGEWEASSELINKSWIPVDRQWQYQIYRDSFLDHRRTGRRSGLGRMTLF